MSFYDATVPAFLQIHGSLTGILNKTGNGTLTLSGTTTFSTGTNVDNGPLVVDVRDLPDGIAGARHAAAVLARLLHPPG